MKKVYRGFTLIELLVVVSIIALLVSILLPALGRAREQAKTALCLTNNQQLGLAFMGYSFDNDDDLPPAYQSALDSVWAAILLPYVGQQFEDPVERTTKVPIYHCPSQRQEVNNDWGSGTPITIDPMDYGVNYCASFEGVFGTNKSVQISQIRQPSEVFLSMDSAPVEQPAGSGNYVSYPYVYAVWLRGYERVGGTYSTWRLQDTDSDGTPDTSSGGGPWNGAAMRHAGGIATLFADGHSDHLKPEAWVRREHWVCK